MKNLTPPLAPGHGTQPVRFLHSHILGLFENAAAELPALFHEQIAYSGANSQIGYDISLAPVVVPGIDANGQIHLQETFLSYLWTLSYSLLVLYQEALVRPQLEPNYVRTPDQQQLISDADRLFLYGQSLKNQYSEWDIEQLPNPALWSENEDVYVQKSSSAFHQALVMIMLHEFAHFYLSHLDEDAELLRSQLEITAAESVEQEYAADNFAIDYMMSGIGTTTNKETVTCGVVVGMCAVLFLQSNLHSTSHPEPHQRLLHAFKRLNLEPDNPLWAFASVALVQWALYNDKPLPGGNTYESYQENFELMVQQFSGIEYYID